MEDTNVSYIKGDDCPRCKCEMKINTAKYCAVAVWICPDCGYELYICDN